MKKKIITIIMILIVTVTVGNKSLAIQSDFSSYYGGDITKGGSIGTWIYRVEADFSNYDTSDMLKCLQDNFGYEGSNLTTNMKLDTTITIVEEKETGVNFFGIDTRKTVYKLKIGNDNEKGVIPKEYTKEELKDLFGVDVDNLNSVFGYNSSTKSWPAVIIIELKMTPIPQPQTVPGVQPATDFGYDLYIKEVYSVTEADYTAGKNKELDVGANQDTKIEIESAIDTAANFIKDTIGNEIKKKLAEFAISALDILRYIPDVFQMILNSLETGDVTERLTWKYDQIKNDNDKNKYANVNDSIEDKITTNALLGPYEVQGNKYEFDKDTEIPVIPVDIYTYAIGKVTIFDSNFLTGQNDVDENGELTHNTVWLFIRNIVSVIMHITIYLSAGFLLAVLIWHGISLVMRTLTPKERGFHVGGVKDFTVALFMLVGVVVVMGMAIFLSRSIFNGLKPQESVEMPVRLSVTGEAHYSFSTNYVGYARYLTEIKNPEELGTKFMAFGEYLALVILNVAITVIMAIRMFHLIKLSIIGPIIAVGKALQKEKILNLSFKDWTVQYTLWTSIQILIAVVYRILVYIEK